MENPDYKNEIRWLLEEKYDGKRVDGFEKDVARIKAGEPVDYVIGWTDFLGCRIDLTGHPLIPRPETEFWAEKAIQDMLGFSGLGLRVLDMFAGSGNIGIAVLRHVPGAVLAFGEKNKKFCKLIGKNAEQNSVEKKRYRIFCSDMFSEISDTYDYILANPPYIPKNNIKNVEQSVREWEPHNALFGGEDGLDYIRVFLKEAKKHLNEKGTIYLEFDVSQKNAVENLAKSLGYRNVSAKRDQYGKWRYAIISL